MKHSTRYRMMCASVLMCMTSVSYAGVVIGDGDGDNVADLIDNCVETYNPDQRDTDADGFGNACDGDLNNDLIVNQDDVELFLTAQSVLDPNADFNGDGEVDERDFQHLIDMSGSAPGPSNIKLNLSHVSQPPSVNGVSLYTTSLTLADGSNGAAMINYGVEQALGSVVSQVLNGKVVPFNDEGIEPDLVPQDGIYSAYVSLNVDQILENEARYIQRLQKLDTPYIKEYAGRAVVDARPMDVDFNSVTPPPITLASGIVLSQLPMSVSTLPALASTVSVEHSLMITDESVVADNGRTFDPCDVDGNGSVGNVNGAWSFKTLMRNMANTAHTGISTQAFTHQWLLNWMNNQVVNSFPINARPNIQSFFPGWDGINSATLNINQLPFRLLAIVNRMDLAKALNYGTGSAGETRLVYGLVDLNSGACSLPGNIGAARQMTVIFEYGDVGNSCVDLKSRAQAWIDLESHAPLPSAAYNAALQALTDTVTLANAAPSKPNRSAINQVRTNDFEFFFPWQLREFVLTAPFSTLIPDTIKQTPDPALFRSGSPVTALFWETNANDILCEKHTVTDSFLGNPFLGAQTEYNPSTFWDAPTIAANLPAAFPSCYQSNVSGGAPSIKGAVRHKFSLNTCDACHAGETNTFFTHVDPGTFPASLSAFLTGAVGPFANPVSDPGGELVERSFDDLTRRGQVLDELATKSCLSLVDSFFMESVVPLKAVH